MNTNDKRIVIICPYLYHLTRGVERFCISLANAFVDKGWQVIIYAWTYPQEQLCGKLADSIRIRKVPYIRYYREQWATLWYRLWLRIDVPKATILNFFYHGEERLSKTNRYLYVLHSPASQIPHRYEFVKPRIKGFRDIHIIAISQLVEQDAKPYFSEKPMSLIYNGTNIDEFKPMINRPQSECLRIITPASYEARKGMHHMIEALADYDERDRIRYDIYGSGDTEYRERLENLIHKYHLERIVSLKGSVTNIPELEPQYDLFALLSKGEAFALSPIEAMACGLPILVSDCPPYPEFVKPDFGYMVNREDKGAIQACLSELLHNKEVLMAKSRAARKASEEYSWTNVVKKYISIIQE